MLSELSESRRLIEVIVRVSSDVSETPDKSPEQSSQHTKPIVMLVYVDTLSDLAAFLKMISKMEWGIAQGRNVFLENVSIVRGKFCRVYFADSRLELRYVLVVLISHTKYT